MSAGETIRIARKHIGNGAMESSARLCLADAVALYDVGDYDAAHQRALKSIAYSVGIMHPDYVACSAPDDTAAPRPAMKERCPYCAGIGWREQRVNGSDIVHTQRCAFCAGTGWVWTEGGAW